MDDNLLIPDLEKNSIIKVDTFEENNKAKRTKKVAGKASKAVPKNDKKNTKRKRT